MILTRMLYCSVAKLTRVLYCLVAKSHGSFATPWTVARQTLSVGFPRQEYWSGLPFPPGDLPDPGIKPTSLRGRQVLYH